MLRILDDGPAAGPENMARDEALLETAAHPTLRLYTWQPACLSLGLFQDYQQVRRQAPAGVAMVRRITGGGTIYHIHEQTYAVVAQLGVDGLPARLRDCYPLIHHAIAEQLRRHGVLISLQDKTVGDRRYHQEVRCFASPAADDLISASGGKALGSAGRNRGGRFLIHGSLKLASNPWDQQVADTCGVDAETAKQCLIAAMASVFARTGKAGQWQAAERASAERILQARYATPDWLERRDGPRP